MAVVEGVQDAVWWVLGGMGGVMAFIAQKAISAKLDAAEAAATLREVKEGMNEVRADIKTLEADVKKLIAHTCRD